MFLFLCKVGVVGEREVKFVQAARGGLSHTRWRMKGQRWHSLAQEWKTFLAENRDATTGRGSSAKPWVSMHQNSYEAPESDLVALSTYNQGHYMRATQLIIVMSHQQWPQQHHQLTIKPRESSWWRKNPAWWILNSDEFSHRSRHEAQESGLFKISHINSVWGTRNGVSEKVWGPGVSAPPRG